MKTLLKRYGKYLGALLLLFLTVQIVTWFAIGRQRLMWQFAEDISGTVGAEVYVSQECFDLNADSLRQLITILETEFNVLIHLHSLSEIRPGSAGRLTFPLVCNSRFVNGPFYAEYRWGVAQGNLSGRTYRSRYVWFLGWWIALEQEEVVSMAAVAGVVHRRA